MFRLYTISAIIGLALAGLAFVSQNSPLLKEENKVAQNQSENLNNLVTGKPFVESLTAKNSNNQANLKENLTEDFTKGIGKIIYENNPSGPQDFYGENVLNAPDPDQIAENLLAEAAQKFDPATLKPEINENSLNISGDNSKSALIKYLVDLDKVIEEARKNSEKLNNVSELEEKEIQGILKIHQEAVAKLYKLSTPEVAVKIHTKEIELLSTTVNILEKIGGHESDPITAILAANYLVDLEKEFKKLHEELLEFVKINIL